MRIQKQETLKEAYLKRAKILFYQEVVLRRKTKIHDLSIVLNMSVEEINRIWDAS